MIFVKTVFVIFLFVFIYSCNEKQIENNKPILAKKVMNKKSLKVNKLIPKPRLLDTLNSNFKNEDLVDIKLFSKDFILDLKYATKDNFVDTILYPCAKCLLRYEVLKDLLKVQNDLKSIGYKIKLFDCYRPLSVQKIMWKKVPVVGLVANPSTGSRHNRGSAVDLTLTDFQGNEINMGTNFDDFSRKSRTFSREVSETVTNNRLFLRKFMEKHNFKGINSEWWHFYHNCGTKYKVSNQKIECDSLTRIMK